ncbi:hypothetical protein HNQ94_000041 [Salirhabdus euzebyi]|uniref:Uncharacterized protein n=1 Tax=Salirhabdus euzebyi TaxID=394506 RepID=A0A841PS51_9BACI|nr:hypothetical protein [Salirhabdus euzebyi]MBB6451620.1 hypothetical protein [Salirhabdus euzebyi]
MTKPVGFDQKILLHHLDYTATEANRTERKEMYEKLEDYLFTEIKGAASRRCAKAMLMKIWFLVEDEHKHLQEEAFKLLPDLSKAERILLHYGMTVLAYPFFGDLVREMGKLFKLQEEVLSQQIGRIMKNLYGERRRVEVATSATLTSLKAWGIITPGEKRYSYIQSKKFSITSNELLQWLAEAIIRNSEGDSLSLDIINSHPTFFPFSYQIGTSDLRDSGFQVNRQGLDMIIVQVV